MKIAIFVETYLPYLNGVVTHVKILKDGLEQQGHEVLIVTADPKARRHYKNKGILHCPARVSKKLYGYGLSKPFSRTRMKYIEKFDPDIIHIQQEFGIGLSGILAAKKLQKPLVYTMHTMYDEYIYYIAPKPFIPATKKLTHAYSKLIARASNEITGPSKKIEEYFQKLGVSKHINVIPNSVELDEFSADNVTDEQKKAIRAEYNISDDKMIALYVGRMGREKSIDVLLKYWAKTVKPQDNIHLLLIGGGPSEEEFRNLATELGVNDTVTFTGKIEHNKLPAY
ncbi:MAG: glycosyltransferase, partial [Oscillospiraceae bacterium]|nr:glycosyltransferase [Oscillospiraceae bacterium]